MVKEVIENKDVSLLPYPNSFERQILEIWPKGQLMILIIISLIRIGLLVSF